MEIRITILDNNDNTYIIVVPRFSFLYFSVGIKPEYDSKVLRCIWATDVFKVFLRYYVTTNKEGKHQNIPLFDMVKDDLYALVNQLFELLTLNKRRLHCRYTHSNVTVRQFADNDEMSRFLQRIILEDYFFLNVQIT